MESLLPLGTLAEILVSRTVDQIKVEGLREFQKALKEMDGESQKQLRTVLNAAADIVVADAAPKVPTRSNRAAKSVRAMSSQREAKVVGGGAKVPYYPWLDFGGRVGKGRTGPKTGATSRPFYTKGRYIYPSFEHNRERIYAKVTEGLVDLARSAGLDVEQT